MDRKQAKEALSNGYKIRHHSFCFEEWVKCDSCCYVFEDGVTISSMQFWKTRCAKIWDDGWEIVYDK